MKHHNISSKTILAASRWGARLLILSLTFTGVLAAQETPEHRWTANVGAGFTPLVGALNKRLDNGWHISFGGGYNFNRHLSVNGQVMYNGLGVSEGVLRELSVPDGNAHLWAFTAEPRFSFAATKKISPYFIGGVGYYRRVVQFTQPTIAEVTIFDPFFGFFPALVPANRVLGTITRDGVGLSAGLGFEIRLGHTGGKLFTEARFHYADLGGIPTRMVPFTIGVRF
jgi:opacity protein-like surface antigen